jgi:Cof subfamily protein (haloacid dehalogenase superfamily)
MDYKIVFFDVDGTITHHEDGTISDSTKEAIQALKNKGLRVAGATGRPLSMCKEIRELGIDTFITANSAYVKYQDHVLHKVPLNQKYIKEVFDFAYTENHALSFYTEDFSMNGIKDTKVLGALKETLSLNEYPAVNERIYEEEVYLMCLFATDEMVETYRHRFPHLSFRRWHPYVLNVLQEDVSKSLAILKVLEHFGIDQSEAIAFGDGENDIDMLELVGLGIAMGNGSENLKSVADFVTKKSSEDGIEYALKRYGII